MLFCLFSIYENLKLSTSFPYKYTLVESGKGGKPYSGDVEVLSLWEMPTAKWEEYRSF